jgi:hypothetical protein
MQVPKAQVIANASASQQDALELRRNFEMLLNRSDGI